MKRDRRSQNFSAPKIAVKHLQTEPAVLATKQVKPRAPTEGNAVAEEHVPDTGPRRHMHTHGMASGWLQGTTRRRTLAALLHHVTPEALPDTFYAITNNTAARIDGMTSTGSRRTTSNDQLTDLP